MVREWLEVTVISPWSVKKSVNYGLVQNLKGNDLQSLYLALGTLALQIFFSNDSIFISSIGDSGPINDSLHGP